jgi:fumarylacetoacetate (FAA) hydrolase family protein
MQLTVDQLRPDDWQDAMLVGRAWIDGPQPGPRTCVLREGMLVDLSALAPTLSQLFDLETPAQAVRAHTGTPLGSLADLLARAHRVARGARPAVRGGGER